MHPNVSALTMDSGMQIASCRAYRRANQRSHPRVGLGTGTPIGEAAGATLGTAGTIMALAPATGPAAPFVMAAGALVSLISSFVGGGCGSACTNAADTEQIYEAAADMALWLGQHGMVTAEEATSFMEALIQAGVQHESQFGTKQSQAGAANLTSVINAEISDAQSLPATATVPLSMSAIDQAYPQPGTAGWQSPSIAAAQQLVEQWAGSLPAPSASGSSSVSGRSVFSSSTVLLLLAGLGAWIIL